MIQGGQQAWGINKQGRPFCMHHRQLKFEYDFGQEIFTEWPNCCEYHRNSFSDLICLKQWADRI